MEKFSRRIIFLKLQMSFFFWVCEGGRDEEGGNRREKERWEHSVQVVGSCGRFFRYTRRRFERTHGSVLNLSTEGFFRESSHATHTTTHTHTTQPHTHTTPQDNTTHHTHNTAQPSTDHDPANVICTINSAISVMSVILCGHFLK